MDQVTKIVPMLWDMAKNRQRFAANVVSKENEIIISILTGKRWRRFKNKNTDLLMDEIRQSHVLT
jgi:hypothetical protein